MQQLLFASNNLGKVREAQDVLSGLRLELISLFQLPEINPDLSSIASHEVEETGSSFADNAKLKAEFFASRTNLLTFADDSGLVVPALGDFPGVASNRWFAGTDAQRNQALLQKMKAVEDRSAFFATVLCLFDPASLQEEYFEARVEGKIAFESEGKEGFGYDPIFIPNGYDKSFAVLGLEVKNKISHRAQAFKQLRDYLNGVAK